MLGFFVPWRKLKLTTMPTHYFLQAEAVGGSAMYFIAFIIILIIWAAILQSIISGAVKTKEMLRHQEAQTKLLMKIAERMGASTQDIGDCLNVKMPLLYNDGKKHVQ